MPQVKTWLKTDLSKPIQLRSLNGELFTFDNQGNIIGVEVYENGEPVTLTGTIAGYVIRPDGETVYIEGEKYGNRAKIVLPSTAYAYAGEITIIIRCVNGDEKTVIAACKAHVTRSETDDIVDPGEVIPGIEDLPVRIIDVTSYFQVSNSYTTIPAGTWSETIPTVNPGQCLWTKEVITWNTDQTTDIYTVSRFGLDGSGGVNGVSVNGTAMYPDSDGIVALTGVGIIDDTAGTGDTNKLWSANKTATLAVKSTVVQATAYAGSWQSGTYPTQDITVAGVTASNNIEVGVDGAAIALLNNAKDVYEAATEARILCTAQGTNSITLTCYGDEPTENIPIAVLIVG